MDKTPAGTDREQAFLYGAKTIKSPFPDLPEKSF
jgi:hypothetical protein